MERSSHYELSQLSWTSMCTASRSILFFSSLIFRIIRVHLSGTIVVIGFGAGARIASFVSRPSWRVRGIALFCAILYKREQMKNQSINRIAESFYALINSQQNCLR